MNKEIFRLLFRIFFSVAFTLVLVLIWSSTKKKSELYDMVINLEKGYVKDVKSKSE